MKHFALAAAMLGASAGYAMAATVTYTSAADGSSIVGSTNSAGTVTIPGFVLGYSGSGGTIPLDAVLQSVTISFSGDWQGTLVATLGSNESTGSIAGNNNWATWLLTGFNQNGVSIPAYVTNTGAQFSATLPSNYNYNSATNEYETPFNSFGVSYSGLLSMGAYNPSTSFYDGVANVNFSFAASVFDVTQSENAPRSIQDKLLNLGATVTYTYEQVPPPPSTVPLPAALPLMGAGLAGLAFVARRRKG
ncbi:VPLPA-CTERM sorting domain-containing protein [Albimonas pacifica]|uniref:VPLPA-CTERM protein sorting domain-containing protein n=1 Tax=Albimonas pacifica TaxID=1114924 RepID=A0A1I3D5X8_9RHOB|nr:VPLPA-CTERM sorting domain-containing protein [Albimonas pacifica]SFH82130.1 VPLPA-CTERM protein sorting domain-containing protein [Albimonas pacifica]